MRQRKMIDIEVGLGNWHVEASSPIKKGEKNRKLVYSHSIGKQQLSSNALAD